VDHKWLWPSARESRLLARAGASGWTR